MIRGFLFVLLYFAGCKSINYEKVCYQVKIEYLDGTKGTSYIQFWNDNVNFRIEQKCLTNNHNELVCNVKSFKAKRLKIRE